VGLTEGHVAQKAASGDGSGRSARNFVHQQVGRVLLEAGGHPDVVNAEESAPSERQIHLGVRASDAIVSNYGLSSLEGN
jgi:hypothetical protein